MKKIKYKIEINKVPFYKYDNGFNQIYSADLDLTNLEEAIEIFKTYIPDKEENIESITISIDEYEYDKEYNSWDFSDTIIIDEINFEYDIEKSEYQKKIKK